MKLTSQQLDRIRTILFQSLDDVDSRAFATDLVMSLLMGYPEMPLQAIINPEMPVQAIIKETAEQHGVMIPYITDCLDLEDDEAVRKVLADYPADLLAKKVTNIFAEAREKNPDFYYQMIDNLFAGGSIQYYDLNNRK